MGARYLGRSNPIFHNRPSIYSDLRTAAQYNLEVLRPEGIGGWRSLYAKFIENLDIASVVEIGSGSPDFLKAIACQKKVAIDAGNRWAEEFREAGAEFIELDLDRDELPGIGPFDVAICSDVFEHLLYPDRTLRFIRGVLGKDACLFSHIPNEFTLKQTVKIMLGTSESLYFHKHCEEFSDPHLHRFTKVGFEKFLRREFRYNLFIGDLKYRGLARLLRALRIPVPYALERGPTFISTNDRERLEILKEVKIKLS